MSLTGTSNEKALLFKVAQQVTHDQWSVEDHILTVTGKSTVKDIFDALPNGAFCIRFSKVYEIQRGTRVGKVDAQRRKIREG